MEGDNPGIRLFNGDGSTLFGSLFHDNTNLVLKNAIGTGNIQLQTNSITRVTVDEVGNVGIGTTGPNTLLSIDPDNSGAKLTLWDGGITTVHYGFGISSFQQNYHVNTTAASHVFYAEGKNGDGTELMRIKGDGDATLAGTLTQNSDRRLKKNIRPLETALPNLLQISGYTFNWKAANRSTDTQIGLIAQEVQAVYPELVAESNDGTLSVNYVGLVPVLIEALKTQQAEIEKLSAEVSEMDELKQRMAKLESALLGNATQKILNGE